MAHYLDRISDANKQHAAISNQDIQMNSNPTTIAARAPSNYLSASPNHRPRSYTMLRKSACYLLALAPFLALPLTAAELLFHAPFDDGIDAKAARGNPKGEYSAGQGQSGKPIYADGISGRGVDFGTARASVSFDGKENIRSDRGTVTLWAKRIGPKPDEKSAGHTYTYHLGGWKGEGAQWVFFYRWEHYTGLCFLHGQRDISDVGIFLPIDGDDGAWHFYAFTWDGPVARAYVDGRFSPNMEKKDFPVTKILSFYVGGGDATGRAIDEVKIFDAVLSGSDIRQMYNEFAGPDTLPFVVIPRRRTPIQIDGKIDLKEWARAVRTSGFSDMKTKLAAATPTLVRLAYDDEALYAALETPLPEKVKQNMAMTAGITGVLKQSINQFDANVDADDAFELNFVPQWPNGTWYRLVVNGINTHYDYSISPTGITELGWNPQWQSASTLDSDGWHAEVRIPFKGFGVGTPKAGEEWGMNFFRIWQALQNGKDAWRMAGRPPDGKPYPVGRVRFGDDAAPVVRLADWGPISDNLLAATGEIVNPGQMAAALEVILSSDSGELNPATKLDIPPGGSSGFEFSGKVQDPRTGMLTLTVKPAGKEPILFCSQTPVMVREVLDIQTFHYPSAGLFRIAVNAGALRDIPLKNLALRIRVLDSEGKEAMPPVSFDPIPAYLFDKELQTHLLKAGKYKVQCSVEHAGKGIAEKTFEYEKQEMPKWYGNTIGITDKAPKPFTPVIREGETLKCWDREYRFGHSLFPEQILTQGSEMLAGPIELVLMDNQGRKLDPMGKATGKWGRHTDFRTEFTRNAAFGPVKVRTENWLECDGLLWTTLRIQPAETKIGKLVVRVPFRKEWSEYINTFDYSMRTTGRLKNEGWQSKDTPVWLGNAIGGMQWLTETLAPCRLSKDAMPVRITVHPKENLFELTLIDLPTELTQPFEVSWGWIATPVRPPTPGYRGWLTRNSAYYPYYAGYYPESSFFDPRWEKIEHPAVVGRSLFLEKTKRPDGRGEELTSAGPYIVTGQCATKVPETRCWSDEWSPSRCGRVVEFGCGAEYATVSPGSKSWADFLVWTYRQTYDRQRYIGLYYDCEMYMPDDNIHHGSGYRTADGTILPVNCVLGARRIAQRMYCMLREREPDQTMILCHHSGRINMAVLSWCDVYTDGENFASRLNKQEIDYHRVFPPDAFLAQSMGRNFGLTTLFLDQFTRSRAVAPEDWKILGLQPTTHLYGLILLHDGGYWRAYGNPDAYKAVDEALAKHHFDADYRMIPYWNQKVVSLPDKVFATFYRNDRSKTVLMVLLNNNDNDRQLTLKMDWKALGFDDPGQLKVDDPVFKGSPTIVNGELVTPVGKANMRLLVILPR
ncbi:MAG: hypothetical protein HY360_08215 [Verrucomicrobia bacterium]|nr:hypothetical protein [Verrucomicrobiota bacterium]